jgi:hypothetical protein
VHISPTVRCIVTTRFLGITISSAENALETAPLAPVKRRCINTDVAGVSTIAVCLFLGGLQVLPQNVVAHGYATGR